MNEQPANDSMQRCQAAISNLVLVTYNLFCTGVGMVRDSLKVEYLANPNLGTQRAFTRRMIGVDIWEWYLDMNLYRVHAANLPAGSSTAALLRYNSRPRRRIAEVNRQYVHALLRLLDATVSDQKYIFPDVNYLQTFADLTIIAMMCEAVTKPCFAQLAEPTRRVLQSWMLHAIGSGSVHYGMLPEVCE